MNTLAFCPRKTKRLEKRAAWILSFDDASYLISPHITKQMIEQTRMKANILPWLPSPTAPAPQQAISMR